MILRVSLLRPSRLMLRLRWLSLLSLPSLSVKVEGLMILIAWLRVLIMCLGSLCMEVLLGLLTIPVSGPEWHRCLPGLRGVKYLAQNSPLLF